MPATVTLDGSNGPGFALVNTVFTGVTSITFDVNRSMVNLKQDSGKITDISILPIPPQTATTVAVTVTNPTTYTVVIDNTP